MHTLSGITIEQPDEKKIEELGIETWPIWEKEPSTFDWHYDEEEVCYFIEGDVVVKVGDQEVEIGKGDLVTFPKGLGCTWNIKAGVKKHYRFQQ